MIVEGAGATPVLILIEVCGPAIPHAPVAETRNAPPVKPVPTFTVIVFVFTAPITVIPLGMVQL